MAAFGQTGADCGEMEIWWWNSEKISTEIRAFSTALKWNVFFFQIVLIFFERKHVKEIMVVLESQHCIALSCKHKGKFVASLMSKRDFFSSCYIQNTLFSLWFAKCSTMQFHPTYASRNSFAHFFIALLHFVVGGLPLVFPNAN